MSNNDKESNRIASWFQNLIGKNPQLSSDSNHISIVAQPQTQSSNFKNVSNSSLPSSHQSAASSQSSFVKPFYSQFFNLSNPIFTGAAGIASLGLVAQFSRKLASTSAALFTRYCTLSMEITSRDKSYQWLLQYLANKPNQLKNQHITCQTTYSNSSSSSNNNNSNNNNNINNNTKTSQPLTKFTFVPSTGIRHTFWYNSKPIFIQRDRDKQILDLNTGTPFESIILRTWGFDSAIFKKLLSEARSSMIQENTGKTILFTATHVDWRPFGLPRQVRKFESVILDDGLSNKVLNDVDEFINSKSWYIDRGIPYRRGYLLYGPPGCGKTSYILALCGHLHYNICVLNLNERGLTDDKLSILLSCTPPNSIILLEDIDCVFVQRITSTNNNNSLSQQSHTLTFSGLLNALDGVQSSEERIVFMTTNYIDRLDSALIRPGRVDRKEYIGFASNYQIKKMFHKFYPNKNSSKKNSNSNFKQYSKTELILESSQSSESSESSLSESELDFLCSSFISAIRTCSPSIELSVADLQGWFLLNKENPKSALINVNQLIEEKQMHSQIQNQSTNINHHQFKQEFQSKSKNQTKSK